MPNNILNEIKINNTPYDFNDKRISDNDVTNWNGKLSSIPIADTNTLGGVKVGDSLKIDSNGLLDENYTITTDSSSTTVTLEIANNNEYRYTQDLTSLTITLPVSIADDFISWIVFSSGSTATSAVYPNTIKWSGDDVSSNVFVPDVNTVYNIGFWYDGINVNAVVRGS